MLCVLVDNELSVSVAFPELSRVAVPKVALPSVKLTLPLGIPLPPAAVTDALREILWPKELGFGVLTTIVVVALLLTVWLVALETEGWKLPSPA
jgi:hypothetical protein